MKKILYILALVLAAYSLSACKKFLETEPQNAVSDAEPIYDLVSAQTALNGTYRALGNTGYYGESWVTLGFFPGGDIKNLTTGGASNLVNVNFRSDDSNFNTTWTAIYATINRANNVIARVPGVSDPLLTDALRNQYLGEAKFIRALCYFDLARGWGGVQLFLEPTTSVAGFPQKPRSSLEETYAQVVQDLTDAENLLPAVTATANRIRASKEAVWALRARVHLYKKEWALAEFYSDKLIASSNYQLLSPYKTWFAAGVGTRESIFELEFSALNPSAIRAQMQHPSRGGTYRYAPTDAFVQLLRTPAVAGGRRALIDSVTQSGITQWFGNLYYRNPATDPTYVLRIAEMYLIRAEARTQQGSNLSGALDDLNAVRARAGVVASTAATVDDLLQAIEDERRLEFALEGHRWFDLARTGRAEAVLEALNSGVSVDSWEGVFPIPNLQLQLDANLIQNPGY